MVPFSLFNPLVELGHLSSAYLRFRYRTRSFIYNHTPPSGNIFSICSQILKPFEESGLLSTEEEKMSWMLTTSKLIRMGGISFGNSLKIYNQGTDFFDDLFKAIQKAQQRILLETYTLEPDETGKKCIQLLTDSVTRGVKLSLILDDFGSSNLTANHLSQLEEKSESDPTSVYIMKHNPISYSPRFWPYNWSRTHRKICIIDKDVGFCGGMNIGDKYNTSDEKVAKLKEKYPEMQSKILVNNFRDTHSQLKGDCLNDLLMVFKESYEENHKKEFLPSQINNSSAIPDITGLSSNQDTTKTEKKLQKKEKSSKFGKKTPRTIKIDTKDQQISEESKAYAIAKLTNPKDIQNDGSFDDVTMQVLPSHPKRGRKSLHRALQLVISNSSKKCYITTPYFLPTPRTVQCILKAKKRGSDVRILTSGISDLPFIPILMYPLYGLFLANGIKVYTYFGKTLHSKTVTIDDMIGSSGSYNFDRFSYFTNMEMGWIAYDQRVAQRIEDDFFKDLERSKELTYEKWQNYPWFYKLLAKFFLFLSRVLAP